LIVGVTFQQTAPRLDNRMPDPMWERSPSINNGQYLFTHIETGEQISCPAMWYNGTVESRLKWLDFCISEGEARVVYWTTGPGARCPNDAKWQLRSLERQQFNLRDLRDRMAASRNLFEEIGDPWQDRVDAEIEAILAQEAA
jgi:hypothetical protein